MHMTMSGFLHRCWYLNSGSHVWAASELLSPEPSLQWEIVGSILLLRKDVRKLHNLAKGTWRCWNTYVGVAGRQQFDCSLFFCPCITIIDYGSLWRLILQQPVGTRTYYPAFRKQRQGHLYEFKASLCTCRIPEQPLLHSETLSKKIKVKSK